MFFSRVVAHHADAQAQAPSFVQKLKEACLAGPVAESMIDKLFVVPRDLGHRMNLAVLEVRDKSD